MNMSGYTKLFSSILASTIWQESKETKIAWITMLASANKDGIVEASIPGLAHMAKLTIPEIEEAIRVLTSPDPYSRTPAFGGRRIEKKEDGWHILNHDKYREKMSAAERTEYNRIKQRESRERRDARDASSMSANVNSGQILSACQRHTEEEAKADSDAKEENTTSSPPGQAGDRFLLDVPVTESSKTQETDPVTLRLYALFKRRPTTLLSKKEKAALAAAKIDKADLPLIEAYYKGNHPATYDPRRRDLLTLIANWNGEVDRARQWKGSSVAKRTPGELFA